MKLSISRIRACLIGSLATAALVLSACGGDSGANGGSAGEDGTVRIVLSEGHSLPFIGVEAGHKLGVWDDKGIEVEIIHGTSSTTSSTLASGNADLALGTGVRTAADILSGLDATLVAACKLGWDQFVLANPDFGAEAPEDLSGASFGISGFGSAGHFSTVTVAENLGWDESDYEIIQLGSLDSMIGALRSGTIDAFVWSIEPVLTAEHEGFGAVLGSVADLVGPNVFEAFFVDNDYAESNPEDVRAFFEGYFEAIEIVQADPDWAKQFIVEDWAKDEAVADEAVDLLLPNLSTDGDIPEENLEGLAEALHLMSEDDLGDDFDIQSIYTYWEDL